MPNTETETDKAERQRLRLRQGLKQIEWQRERGRTEYRDRKGQTQRGTESKTEAEPRPDTQRRNQPR
eukprot:6608224-Lingulodinium_polyedra.AAC.1